MRFEAEAFNALANGADLVLGGMRLHDDKHERIPQRGKELSLRQGGELPQIMQGKISPSSSIFVDEGAGKGIQWNR